MTKKGLNKKEARLIIQNRLLEGKTRQEILEELSEMYFDKSTIEKLIASTPDKLKKEKYKTLNNILLGLLVLSIIIKILIGLVILSDISIFLTPIALAIPFITILFAFEVARFHGYIYKTLGLLTIASIFNVLSKMGETGAWGIVDLIFCAIVAGLAFYIGDKMFPNYGLFGPRKDEKGNIFLE